MAVPLPVTMGDQTYGPPGEYPQWLQGTADINGDKKVDISDVILILRKAIGLDP